MSAPLVLTLLPAFCAVSRLERDAAVPQWATGEFVSITRTHDELSIVCDDAVVPASVRTERSFRCFKVNGPIPFETTGVASALTAPLAAASISVFIVATFDTDYVLVKSATLDDAIAALRSAGHVVRA
ncbi:MAG: ACT domain-containing protein [Acidobacteriota bacterium]